MFHLSCTKYTIYFDAIVCEVQYFNGNGGHETNEFALFITSHIVVLCGRAPMQYFSCFVSYYISFVWQHNTIAPLYFF